MPTDITKAADLESILSSHKFAVVDFYADWCPPCKAIAPLYAKLSAEHGVEGVFAFLKVNVDNVPEVAQTYSVSAMPTFMFFANGKPAAVDVALANKGLAQVGPNGVELIKGADPRTLNACVVKLSELAKSGGGKNTAAAPAAETTANGQQQPDLTTYTRRKELERKAERKRQSGQAERLERIRLEVSEGFIRVEEQRRIWDMRMVERKTACRQEALERRAESDRRKLVEVDFKLAKVEEQKQKLDPQKNRRKLAKLDEKKTELEEKRRKLSQASVTSSAAL